ncbi:hypothetical protein G7Z17_g3793 [Cylindrodendrum hubeiense]|uniref:Uncharacterized protein n=1 Tax=Cylindrodendrum hubeiense TaxID=595255 RepID=A0A9P5LAG0_9HYPO|nr:hypothetical protein G7Z17_g3793 [Cylindrodendrum hubeiense]
MSGGGGDDQREEDKDKDTERNRRDRGRMFLCGRPGGGGGSWQCWLRGRKLVLLETETGSGASSRWAQQRYACFGRPAKNTHGPGRLHQQPTKQTSNRTSTMSEN